MVRSIRLPATFLAIIIIFSAVYSPSAFAYIDPGTGSVLLQTLVASISMVIAALFGWRTKLVLLWKRLFHRGNLETTTDMKNSNSVSSSPVKTDKDAT